jgi:hypothetical protein
VAGRAGVTDRPGGRPPARRASGRVRGGGTTDARWGRVNGHTALANVSEGEVRAFLKAARARGAAPPDDAAQPLGAETVQHNGSQASAGAHVIGWLWAASTLCAVFRPVWALAALTGPVKRLDGTLPLLQSARLVSTLTRSVKLSAAACLRRRCSPERTTYLHGPRDAVGRSARPD